MFYEDDNDREDDEVEFESGAILLGDIADTNDNFLVEDVLAAGKPAVWAGPFKCLKTSVAIDLAVSVACPGQKFLGAFDVGPSRHDRNVLFISGENDRAAVHDIFRRICAHKGVEHSPDDPVGVDFLSWQPRFNSAPDLERFRREIEHNGPALIVVDPIGRSLSTAASSTLAAAYSELGAAGDIAASCGATLLVLHHATKGANVRKQGLRSCAGAGIAEWARQWMLFDRIGKFDKATGRSRIHLEIGGAAGHGGNYVAEIVEGRRVDDGGRVWAPSVKAVADAPTEDAAPPSDVDAHGEKILAALRENEGPATARNIAKGAGQSGRTFAAAVRKLVESGAVLESKTTVKGRERVIYTVVD